MIPMVKIVTCLVKLIVKLKLLFNKLCKFNNILAAQTKFVQKSSNF